jgi:serine/threonine protein kinase
MLACNQLQSLPEELSACTQLELLRIAANRFHSLPEWLFKLPRLSWLAYAGNPYSEKAEQQTLMQHPVVRIQWQQLELQQKLGEGASGVIHQASWQRSSDLQLSVAVKLFKGAQTSDGLPQHEMAACISAGSHPNLIKVLGTIEEHPANSAGLVMALIPPHFQNLAGPPSLDSCTRDVYQHETKFTLDIALRIALDIASVALHLHQGGLMHGDLYAHNILHNGQDSCLLGDFGAASFIPRENEEHALSFQRLEVRAFACLLEELMARCEADIQAESIYTSLYALQASCMQENSESRPLFAEIVQHLSVLTVAK